MPMRNLDPELRGILARDMLTSLDQMLQAAPPDDTLPVRSISAQVRMVRMLCGCGDGGPCEMADRAQLGRAETGQSD